MRSATLYLLILAAVSFAASGATPDVAEIVKRSVVNNEANWKAAPAYIFMERDITTKGGDDRKDRTYEIYMIGGGQYHKLIAVNGEPLPPAQAAAEQQKLEQEQRRVRNESPEARHKRVAEYQAERRQNHALMAEMVNAFQFKLVREEIMNGRDCYVLDATPKPGYEPKSRETKVLTGMRGKMWIDKQTYQWVKVHAEVFRPVAFGLFVAHVEPGTEFTLEETPVAGNIWLPSHFAVQVKANVLFWSRNSTDSETYMNYRRIPQQEQTARR